VVALFSLAGTVVQALCARPRRIKDKNGVEEGFSQVFRVFF